LVEKFSKFLIICYQCGKFGHIKLEYPWLETNHVDNRTMYLLQVCPSTVGIIKFMFVNLPILSQSETWRDDKNYLKKNRVALLWKITRKLKKMFSKSDFESGSPLCVENMLASFHICPTIITFLIKYIKWMWFFKNIYIFSKINKNTCKTKKIF